MDYNFRKIAIYFDEKGNLIGIPTTIAEKWNVITFIEPVQELNVPYNDWNLETFICNVLQTCYSKKIFDIPKGQSPLQKYLHAKSYSSSVNGRGLVMVTLLEGQKYQIYPQWKDAKMKNAFHPIDNKMIEVPNNYVPGELAHAFHSAMVISPVEPLYTAPKIVAD